MNRLAYCDPGAQLADIACHHARHRFAAVSNHPDADYRVEGGWVTRLCAVCTPDKPARSDQEKKLSRTTI